MAEILEDEQIFNKNLQRRIQELIDQKKTDQTTIGKAINMSSSVVSLYLKSKYTGRVNEVEEKLSIFLKDYEKQNEVEYKSLAFVETQVVRRVFNAANLCRVRSKMGVIVGSPGIGKTTAIKDYQTKTTGTVIIEPTQRTSARAILGQLAKLLKISFQNNTSHDELINMVCKRLERNKYLIIIDESENLKVDCFNVLRKIFDRAEGNCGLLFVGTEELQGLLMKIRSGFPYISSRIGYFEQLDALKGEDIKKLVYQYFPNCEESLIKYIAKISNNNARKIQNVLDLCMDITISNKIELNEDVISAAGEKLFL